MRSCNRFSAQCSRVRLQIRGPVRLGANHSQLDHLRGKPTVALLRLIALAHSRVADRCSLFFTVQLAVLSHLLNILFLNLVEIPHMNTLYQSRVAALLRVTPALISSHVHAADTQGQPASSRHQGEGT